MKKKLLSILLALVLVFGMMTFAGCGQSDDSYHDDDENTILSIDGNRYTYEITTEYLYIKTTETSQGTFVKDGKNYTFNEESLVVKHYVFDTLVTDKQLEATTFVGKEMPDDMIKTSRTGVVYKGSFRPYLASDLNLEHKGCYDVILQKNSDADTILTRVKDAIYYASEKFIQPETPDFATSDISVDVSKTGPAALSINFDGKTFEFDAYVCEGNPDQINFHTEPGLNISTYLEYEVLIGTTLNEWLDRWRNVPNSLNVFYKGEYHPVLLDDVTITGWVADQVSEKTEFTITLSATYEGQTFSRKITLLAYNPDDTAFYRMITDPLSNLYKASYISRYEDFEFFMIPEGGDIEITKYAYNIAEGFVNVYAIETEHFSDYIDVNTKGVKTFDLKNEFGQPKQYVVWVYDKDETPVKSVSWSGTNYSTAILVNGQLIDGPCIKLTYAGSIQQVDPDNRQQSIDVVYSKDRLEKNGYSAGQVVIKLTLDGKTYTFRQNVRTVYVHKG